MIAPRKVNVATLAASLGLAALGHWEAWRARARPLELRVAPICERERLDGAWEAAPIDGGCDRVQLTVTASEPARLYAIVTDARGRRFAGAKRAAGWSIEAGRRYALPSPREFFELSGKGEVALVVSRGELPALEAAALERRPPPPLPPGAPLATTGARQLFPLTDGSLAEVEVLRASARAPLAVRFATHPPTSAAR